ncbi:uncharacterized protein F5891DRAFT_1182404 [Suillus fuscotomentosus]|uniref:Uncharacterized protein n=1 Tax=Suillus fuscotomentosus TaxID=1912939 RepID=A0AAD4EHI8_9AGAM|nr:uncharacterized protein F5891DRAFT_1182404 [Suillus fuscotomentosus]KAG1906186.1 hypothetical protein F5891DRAFT_1182404 [Suillus fuscotomentosus]
MASPCLVVKIPEWFPGAGFKCLAREWHDTLEELVSAPYKFVLDQMAAGIASESFTSNLLGGGTLSADEEDDVKWSAATLYGGASETVTKAELQEQMETNEKLMQGLGGVWERGVSRTRGVRGEREQAPGKLGITVEKNLMGVHIPKKDEGFMTGQVLLFLWQKRFGHVGEIQAGGIDTEVELLSRSVPIWPTQLRRYTEITLPESLSRDYNVQKMQIDLTRREVRGHWEEFVHPSGAIYYYNAKSKTYTGMNVRDCSDERLQKLESWIEVSRSKLDGKHWLLVVEPILARGKEIYPYYYVVPENRIITWIEPVDAFLLFQECETVWHWNHKRLELEAQYWKHVEYFPHGIEIRDLDVRALRLQLNWCQALALEQSIAGSIFWTLDQMKEMMAELATAEELARSDGVMEEQGVAICGKLLHVLRHHEFLNHHGQPEARLMRTHSLGERHRDLENSPFINAVAVAMLWIPMMVLRRLRKIYVDGLVNGVDMNAFLDDFNAQAKSQTTVASVIMAVDASILAIPGLGSALATKTLCSISFVLSAYCIIACTIAQQFGHRMRSLDFAV